MFERPIPVPSAHQESPGLPSTLTFVSKVPRSQGNIFASGGGEIDVQLKKIADSIVLGYAQPTEEQADQLRETQELLYEDGDPDSAEHTAVYKKYLEYEQQYSATATALRNASSLAERAALQSKLSRIDQDWTLFGKKSEISRALNVISQFDSRKLEESYRSWRSLISAKPSPDHLWQALANLDGWLSISVKGEPSGRSAAVRGRESESDPERVMSRVRIAGFAAQIIRVQIGSPSLEHPFLQSTRWKSSGKFVISDGDPAGDTQAELIPRRTTALIIARHVDIYLSDMKEWKTIASAMETCSDLAIEGLVIKAGGHALAFTSPRYIGISGPLGVGVLVESLPKIPNPEPNLQYKELNP